MPPTHKAEIMKVKILTCNRANNYGARLQAYALWRYVSNLGHDTAVIDYCPMYLDFYVKALYFPTAHIKEWVKLVVRYPERRSKLLKFKRLEEFSSTKTQLTEERYTSLEKLRSNPPQADVYIAGSDQIWNTSMQNGLDPAFYLAFGAPGIRRISYAASLATEDFDSVNSHFIRSNIARFDAVSVREESGKKITDKLGLTATICCDPAFLINQDEWNEICDYQESGSGYLLVYDIEHRSKIRALAKKIAKARRLKILTIGEHPLLYGSHDYSDCSPTEFLGLIRNADCVISNSLHGTIFSIIFRRDFYFVERTDGLNARMTDLLIRYGLQQRNITATSDDHTLRSKIDYSTIVHKIHSDIDRSKHWLSSNLATRI